MSCTETSFTVKMADEAKELLFQEGADGLNKRGPFGLRITTKQDEYSNPGSQSMQISFDIVDSFGREVLLNITGRSHFIRIGDAVTLTGLRNALSIKVS